jgi:riboflavin biosynthesis pyrimidine reductase
VGKTLVLADSQTRRATDHRDAVELRCKRLLQGLGIVADPGVDDDSFEMRPPACSRATPQTHLDCLRERGIDAIIAGTDRVDLRAALLVLNKRYGVTRVRADSSGTLNGALLRAGLVEEVSLLIHPQLVGGTSCRSFYRAPDLTDAKGVIPSRLRHCEKLRNDVVWLIYDVVKP